MHQLFIFTYNPPYLFYLFEILIYLFYILILISVVFSLSVVICSNGNLIIPGVLNPTSISNNTTFLPLLLYKTFLVRVFVLKNVAYNGIDFILFSNPKFLLEILIVYLVFLIFFNKKLINCTYK